MNESAVDNALVEQKNELLRDISIAEDADVLEQVLANIAFCRPLWSALGYDYKRLELMQRVRERAAVLADGAEGGRDGVRRNSRIWQAYDREAARCRGLSTVVG